MKKNVHNKDTTGIRRPLRISAALIRKEMGMSVVVILGVPWDNHFISGESLINDRIFDIDILHQKIYMVKMGGGSYGWNSEYDMHTFNAFLLHSDLKTSYKNFRYKKYPLI